MVSNLVKKSGLNPRLASWFFTHNVGREDATVLAEPTPESLGFEAANYNIIAQICSGLYLYADEEAADEYLKSLEESKTAKKEETKIDDEPKEVKVEL